MTYQIFLLLVLLLPGLLAHQYYQHFVQKEALSLEVISRIAIISVFSYVFRGLIGIFQGYGDAGLMVYFANVDNLIKYVFISVFSSFLLINSYIYLEQVLLPKWAKSLNQVSDKKAEEGTSHEA